MGVSRVMLHLTASEKHQLGRAWVRWMHGNQSDVVFMLKKMVNIMVNEAWRWLNAGQRCLWINDYWRLFDGYWLGVSFKLSPQQPFLVMQRSRFPPLRLLTSRRTVAGDLNAQGVSVPGEPWVNDDALLVHFAGWWMMADNRINDGIW